MKRTNFPLNQKELLWIIPITFGAALWFGFRCFLSFNFLLLGDTVTSISYSAIIVVILSGLAFTAIYIKKTSRPSKAKIIWEGVLLCFFVVFAFVAIFPFSHYFVISEKKSDIQQKLSQNVLEAQNMFMQYESYANNRTYFFEQELSNAILRGHNGDLMYPDKYEQFGFQSGGDDNKQKHDKIEDLQKGLFFYPFVYQDRKEKASNWLLNAQRSIDLWAPISIVYVVNDMDSNIHTWFNEMVQLSKARGSGEIAVNFDEDINTAITIHNVKGKFKKAIKDLFFATTIWAIGEAMLLYFLIWLPWLPWIGVKRHTRYPGLKVLFGTEKIISGAKRSIITQ